jgi:hypothetical protein
MLLVVWLLRLWKPIVRTAAKAATGTGRTVMYYPLSGF